MLQKDQGNPRIHRLRIIHIYEADYNLLLAVKWRQATHHAEDHKLLNDGMYGSRPGRSAHEPALIEVLQHETYRMSMKPGVNFDLDATSCYDRILTSLASLCSRRIGLAKSVALVNSNTLEAARYHLKTSLGISEQYYQHCNEYPIYGTGQGSGNSPAIWCFVCSTLFDAFQSKAHGAEFISYDGTLSIQLYMIGFVDDCAQRVNKFSAVDQPSANELVKLMEKDAQLWNDLLWTSGGALEQSKCSFHLVQSSWTADGHPFLSGGKTSLSIDLTHKGNTTPTYQKSNYESHKTLGCYINPAQCTTKAWEITQQKNHTLATILETNYFSRQEAWTLYTSVYLPSVTYPLSVTPLPKHQCEKLDVRFLRTLVPRCGYNRNMSRSIRYAPASMGGAGFKQIYVEQGALLTQQIFKHLNDPTSLVGRMLRITISWTQAFLGISEFFLTNVDRPIPPVGPSILIDLRTFLKEIGGQLKLSNHTATPLLRHNDRSIMDIVMSQTQWSRKQIMQINACRRYLQAQTLADITTMLGTRVQSHAHQALTLPDPSTIRISRFNQCRPGRQAWVSWRKFLRTISDANGVLTTALGDWIVDYTRLRHWPPHLYDPRANQLYSHYEKSWYRSHECIGPPGIFNIEATGQAQLAQGYPVFTYLVNGTLRTTKNFIDHHNQQPPSPHNTYPNVFPYLNPWEKELLESCQILVPHNEICELLLTATIETCSDGSATRTTGSFGFVMATTQGGRRLVTGNGMAPGARPNSFRSEAYGVLATMRILYHLTKGKTSDTPIVITHYLDNKSVIHRIKMTQRARYEIPNRKLLPEQDVIDEINQTMKQLPFTIELEWVKGHQDSRTAYASLPLTAQLNCDADREATTALQTITHQAISITPLPCTPCQLLIQGQSVTSKIKQRAHEAAQLPKLKQYLINQFKWDNTIFEDIDWELFKETLKKYRDQRPTIVKHIHDISPTGHIAHRNDHHLPHECPICESPYEDNLLVLQCPHSSRRNWQTKTIDKVCTHLTDESDHNLIDILHDGLLRLHRQLPPIPVHTYPDRYHTLLMCQTKIGWDQLYKGRWSLQWTLCHEAYTSQQPNTSKTIPGRQWALSFSRLLIDQWLKLWELRNEQRHGKDDVQRKQFRIQTLTAALTELYNYRERVCPMDRAIFHESVEEHLAKHKSLDRIEDWINSHSEAIKNSVRQAETMGITNNHTIHEYLTPNPTSPESP